MSVRRWAAGVLLAVLAALALAASAPAQTAPTTTTRTDPNALSRPDSLTGRPIGLRLTGQQARTIAARSPKVAEALDDHPTARAEVFLKGGTRWQISWFTPGSGEDRKEVAQVLVDDRTGGILEAWNGPQVAWTMARGYAGAFGRKVNSPWVWIPLTVLFLAPFLDVRRPLRVLHLDLAVLVAFGISVAFFNDANLDASVPLIAPLLAYLLARLAWIGLRSRPAPRPPRLHLNVPVTWLAVAVVFLVGFRVGLNVTDSNVIDVGYSGVIGADKLADGDPLYGGWPADNERGDTYGPFAYEVYVPFEQALPWSGRWDDLPAAHGAAIVFDLLATIGLFFLGRRVGGRGLGIVLAYLWTAWPFSLYAMNTNTNDTLVTALGVLVLLLAARPAARGAAAALAAFAKFGALALVPLLATHGARRGTWWRTVLTFAAAFLVVAVLVWLPVIADGQSPRLIYDRTVGYQASRGAPFSLWGLYGLDTLQQVWQALALLFAVAVAFLPRRRDVVGLAALAGAVTIAVQLSLTYWFYLYLVWFFPFAVLAFVGRSWVPAAGRR